MVEDTRFKKWKKDLICLWMPSLSSNIVFLIKNAKKTHVVDPCSPSLERATYRHIADAFGICPHSDSRIFFPFGNRTNVL